MLERPLSSAWRLMRLEHGKSLWKKIEDDTLALLSRLPGVPLFGKDFFSPGVFGPHVFLVAFILFLGLSDHALSGLGMLGIVLGLAFFLLGMKTKNLEIPRINERFFLPLLFLTSISFLLVAYDWDTFQKFSYIPLLLLLLTGKHTQRICILVILLAGFFFSMGLWAVSGPYLLISAFFLSKHASFGFFCRNAPSIFFMLFVAGSFFFFLDISLVVLETGYLPLLSEESRNALDPKFTMFSHLLPLSCILLASLKKRSGMFLVFAFSLFCMTALGFRTQVVFLFLATLIAASQSKMLTKLETSCAFLSTAIVALLLTGLRSLVLKTNLSLFEAIRLRVGLTLDIYDLMASLGGVAGYTKGQVYISSIPGFARLMPNIAWAPRRMVAELVGMKGSATSTLLGPVAVDFGLLGIIAFMFFLGYLLGRLFELSREGGIYTAFYASCLAYSVIGIETGLVDFEVLLLFLMTFLFIQPYHGPKT